MIILDTNVISEFMRDNPEQVVADWLDAQDLRSLYTTTVNVMELHYGIHKLPVGKRKTDFGKFLSLRCVSFLQIES